jgi:hypothetical protein
VWKECLAQWVALPSQTLFRADSVRAAGGFSTTLNPIEDIDLELRLTRQGPFILRPAVVADYRQHEQQSYGVDGASIDEMDRKLKAAFDDFLSSLSPRQRKTGTRIRVAAEEWLLADRARDGGKQSIAIRHYAKTCAVAPALVISPLTGPVLLRGFALALVDRVGGQRAIELIRGIKRRALRAIGRGSA